MSLYRDMQLRNGNYENLKHKILENIIVQRCILKLFYKYN